MNVRNSKPNEGKLTEWLLRFFPLCFYVFAVVNLFGAWLADTSRWTIVFLLITEGYTLILVLLARNASVRDLSPFAVIATGYATLFFVFLHADGTVHLIPEAAGLLLQAIGLVWQFASKIALGRSFGLLPAHRKVVLSGPYRIVRHPIYLGYLIGHLGFLFANWSWRNAIVLAILYVAQVYRIRREEALLASDPVYNKYRLEVRWRLIPGVF